MTQEGEYSKFRSVSQGSHQYFFHTLHYLGLSLEGLLRGYRAEGER